MDMSNTTSAGPSRGLLDILFGDGKEEKKTKEDFDPVLALAAALEKSQEELKMKQAEIEAIKGDSEIQSQLQAIQQMGSQPVPGEGLPGGVGGSVPPPAMDERNALHSMQSAAISAREQAESLLSQIRQNPNAINEMRPSDRQNVLNMIEERMAQLKEQMPALRNLEKAIARDGIDKVMAMGTVSDIVQKLEQGEIRSGISTEEFLRMGAGAKESMDSGTTASRASNSFTENGLLDGQLSVQKPNGAQGNANTNMSGNGNSESGTGGNLFGSQSGETIESSLPNNGLSGFSPINGSTSTLGAEPIIDLGTLSASSVRRSFVPEAVKAVEFLATDGGGEMKISLNPKEIGPVQLQVKSMANQVRVELIVENQELADAIRSNKDSLIDSLKEQKITVSNVEVTVKASSSGSSDMNFADSDKSGDMNDAASEWAGNRGQQADAQSGEERNFANDLSDELNIDSGASRVNTASEVGKDNNDSRPDPNRLIDLEA